MIEALLNPFTIILALVGFIFVITGSIMYKFPPKNINHLYGYRTSSSMTTQERWDLAQEYSSKLMRSIGIVFIFLSLIPLGIFISEVTGIILAMTCIIISTILLFINTENAIKNKFKNE